MGERFFPRLRGLHADAGIRNSGGNFIALAGEKKTVIMCAEAVPWRCHRSLVGDALLVRGVEVQDILSETNSRPHKMTPWARVDGLQITYPKIE